ncbi:MAG: threonylcarbamoyl-AMP synthase [Dysgonamonadaceae bacterium]|nr:threonylcarbamoyl-AMP synthase [Dysgonamonadaceae bacterium]
MQEEIKKTVETLLQGGIILYPTDTVWGIGCDATNAGAVARIYEIKRRCDTKSMLVLLDSVEKLIYYTDCPDIARQLVEQSVDPLTIIYPDARNLAKNLIAEDGSIGIRIPRETFSQTLCRQFGKPIVSTSANFSGEPSPDNFYEINPDIISLMDYTVYYRRNESEKHKPSAIIAINKDETIRIIRK